ncbi:calcium-binding protein [Clostridium cellulovorans]|uniref:Hemolysin-type calcium-binding region n=1 Tax=Clostridium cellulovorans (strain ATCC 35296 / DSM 3052 / OCM 3 / 743B) TaxID=573061 RepID=D9SPU0_CLOC7|nr:calcium-binding protein [Clostridium cellulovorans]ADL52076.1 Hemolysin-type calcium-binding region [Clostridium cellulovorans 743B]
MILTYSEKGDGQDIIVDYSGEANTIIDTYIFRKGYGQVNIYEYSGEANTIIDTLKLEDINPNEISLNCNRYDLIMKLNESKDSITIQGYFSSDLHKIEKIQFADGTVWDINTIKSSLVYSNGTVGIDSLNAEGEVIMNGYEGDDTLRSGAGNDKIYGGTGNDQVYGNGGNDLLYGEDGDDKLYGGNGDDILDGGEGKDYLYGENGNDLLDGKNGGGYLEGGAGVDTYIFRKGYGQVNIYEYSGEANTIIDTLKLEDINPNEISLNCNRYDLIMKLNESKDSITIQGYFSSDLHKIEKIQFADGTVWDINTIKSSLVYSNGTVGIDSLNAEGEVIMNGYEGDDTLRSGAGNDKIYGGTGNDQVYGNGGNDLLYGEDGDDKLYGGNGDDILDGGEGKDYLYGENGNDLLDGKNGGGYLEGGAGNDTYIFSKGDGQDIIYNSSSLDTDNDKLSLNDVNLSETAFIKSNTDLIIKLNETTDSVTILGYFNYGKYSLEEIEFMNGETLTPEDVNNVILGKYVSHTIPQYNISLDKAIEILSEASNPSIFNITGTSTSSDIMTDILLNMNS